MLAVRRLYLGCAGVYTYLKYFIGMQINLSDKVHMLFSKYFRVLCLDLLRCCLRYGLLRSSPPLILPHSTWTVLFPADSDQQQSVYFRVITPGTHSRVTLTMNKYQKQELYITSN